MIKENLKIVSDKYPDREEAVELFSSMGLIVDTMSSNCVIGHTRYSTGCKSITLPELRELAKPREYLNDEFELVETNQPLDGWQEVPISMNILISSRYRMDGQYTWFDGDCDMLRRKLSDDGFQILWQRNPKEKTMNTENKGRFLHQAWYELNAKQEIQVGSTEYRDLWDDVTGDTPIRIFNEPDYKFRIKPQTMQIGSRTINKPISVKPKVNQDYFVVNTMDKNKFSRMCWLDGKMDNYYFENNLCHLTAEDAVNMTDAILSLMK